ncbi:MAG: hypothetical protein FWF66_00550 [Candidatus Bathyarchaeota archaeon]|nr:hypothetical protein [Candidatus Termiticorpusculum sp.]
MIVYIKNNLEATFDYFAEKFENLKDYEVLEVTDDSSFICVEYDKEEIYVSFESVLSNLVKISIDREPTITFGINSRFINYFTDWSGFFAQRNIRINERIEKCKNAIAEYIFTCLEEISTKEIVVKPNFDMLAVLQALQWLFKAKQITNEQFLQYQAETVQVALNHAIEKK